MVFNQGAREFGLIINRIHIMILKQSNIIELLQKHN